MTQPTPAALQQKTPFLSAVPSPILVISSIFSIQFGAVIAVQLFPSVGTAGVATMRVGIAAIILNLLWRPRWNFANRKGFLTAVLFGLSLAAMNFLFYLAIDRIPLGLAVTIEFVGPLGVAVAGSRRIIDIVWVALAGTGIVLLSPWSGSNIDPLGILFVLGAGFFWALYIIFSARIGKEYPGGSGLAIAMSVGGMALLPFGVIFSGLRMLNPLHILGGIAIAVLSSAVPYSLDIEALRRIPTHIFGILMSLEPAIATLAGFLLLRESIDARGIVALLLVTIATIGSTTFAQSKALIKEQ